jgi:hypothetical protein
MIVMGGKVVFKKTDRNLNSDCTLFDLPGFENLEGFFEVFANYRIC